MDTQDLLTEVGEQDPEAAIHMMKLLLDTVGDRLQDQEVAEQLLDYLDYYNNRRIKAKLKGLPPAIHRQQALSVA